MIALLAQFDAELWRKGFNEPNPVLSIGLALFFGAVILFLAGTALYVKRKDMHVNLNSHSQLFDHLCKAHGLQEEQRKLLRQLARLCNIRPPTLLFVRYDMLDSAIAAWEEHWPKRDREPLRALQRHLYDTGLSAARRSSEELRPVQPPSRS